MTTDPHEQQPPSPQLPPQPGPPAPKRLLRTSADSPISGLCGGIAAYLAVDPTLIRVLAVIAAFFTFPVGPLVYLVLWAIVPKDR